MNYEKMITDLMNQYLPDGYYVMDYKESKSSTYIYIAPESLKWMEVMEDDYRVYKFRISSHNAMCTRSIAHADVVINYFHESGYEVNLDMFSLNSFEDYTYQPKDVELTDDTFFTKNTEWFYRQIAVYFCSKIN
ncbi:hypothetical protein [Massilibacteroides sp.]|uniref:hypothetical protein n=1 Tax=Massilibacteroides sp. TaxID=2034766 RepID=UPI002606C678|nr:hypothetical protein [Massilibacteroides sp.]MDD4515688.1 hypothetical protein [Massilibacteroides sp.]